MLDSLRRDHVGCYGNDWIKTPNIDALAKEGVRFTNAYPEALPTIPVRRAMNTGMRTFPCRDYVLAKGDTVMIPGWQPIPESQTTMAEIFRYNGYNTALIASTPHIFKPSMNFHRGFTSWEWIRGQEADRYEVPFEGEIEDPANLPNELSYGCVGHSLHHCLANMQDWEEEKDWFPPQSINASIDWLEKNAKNGPFLLEIDEFDPHEPWNAPKDFLELYFDTDSYEGRRVINTTGGPYDFREGELEYTFAQYAGEVTLCDKYVGVLMDKLKDMGLWNNTIVALVSDHGHNIMDHGIIHKLPDHMYPELMDLVYIIRHPESSHGDSECDAYVAHHDIPVTLMSMAGIELSGMLDGADAWKWVTVEAPITREYATCMFYPWLWYQDNRYAYLTDLDGTEEKLYDRKTDPKQMNNIAAENPKVCKMLRGVLWDEMDNDPPSYDVVRSGHEWYEYPDLHDPSSEISDRLRKKFIKS
jgi:arylsulfatase A-like enzyme